MTDDQHESCEPDSGCQHTTQLIGTRPSTIIPGYNVDRINIEAGVEEAKSAGITDPESLMVVEYALGRWARGEEQGALDSLASGGIDMTVGIRVIAAGKAHAIQPKHSVH